jgi:hypothetical protein
MAWQCKLFHYSCVTRLGLRPVFIVHELDEDWHPYFVDIVASGGIVRRAPSYRTTRKGHDYSPRNTAGTLLQASAIGYRRDHYIVICDPDMIFVRNLVFPLSLAAERAFNLDYNDKRVRYAARRFGITDKLLNRVKTKIEYAVPYVTPVSHASSLAETWMEAIDCFQPGLWETSMYALGMAAIKLKLNVEQTHFVTVNDEHDTKTGDAAILHYAYGDEVWNKRHYCCEEDVPSVWEPYLQTPRETVLGEVISQLKEANDFYTSVRLSGRKY